MSGRGRIIGAAWDAGWGAVTGLVAARWPWATYTLLDGAPLHITHHGQPITASAGTPGVAPIPAAPA